MHTPDIQVCYILHAGQCTAWLFQAQEGPDLATFLKMSCMADEAVVEGELTVIVGRALTAASSWGPTGFSIRKLSRFWGTGSACAPPMMLPHLYITVRTGEMMHS